MQCCHILIFLIIILFLGKDQLVFNFGKGYTKKSVMYYSAKKLFAWFPFVFLNFKRRSLKMVTNIWNYLIDFFPF